MGLLNSNSTSLETLLEGRGQTGSTLTATGQPARPRPPPICSLRSRCHHPPERSDKAVSNGCPSKEHSLCKWQRQHCLQAARATAAVSQADWWQQFMQIAERGILFSSGNKGSKQSHAKNRSQETHSTCQHTGHIHRKVWKQSYLASASL